MGAGTYQVEFVSFGAVNQKPVRLDMSPRPQNSSALSVLQDAG